MLNTILSWGCGGLALFFIYVLISNTLWFLFGSRLIQCLPGVNIKGVAGTFKIATMLVLSVLGSIIWLSKYCYMSLMGAIAKPTFKNEVSKMIQQGARFVENTRNRIN